ncbi:MAG: hypothetical protein ACM3JJ_06975 [Hyphomicrobiales bacterium]
MTPRATSNRRRARAACGAGFVLALGLTLAMAPAARAAGTAGAPGKAGAAPAAADTTRVTYLAGSSVYLEAGSARGLAAGDTVSVVRGARTVATLVVTTVSSRRAVCDTLRVKEPPQVGDTVLFRAHAEPTAVAADSSAGGTLAGTATSAAAAPGAGATTARARASRLHPVRGRIAAGFLRVDGDGSAYSRPSLDFLAEGRTAWGAPLDFSVDVRSHRVLRPGESEGEARVYRLSATSRSDGGGRAVTVGRQYLPFVSGVGLFDGLLGELGGGSVTLGLFSGFEPAITGYDFDTGVLQSGGYVRYRTRPDAAVQGGGRWSFVVGGLDTHDHGTPSRAALFAQSSYAATRLWMTAAQEVDLNSAWKQARGEPSVSLTSTFVTMRAQVAPRLALSAGYDGRRNVLLLRDRETPETAFDDRLREGAWTGLSANLGWKSRLDGSARWTSGGAAGTAWSWSGSLERASIPPLDGTVRWRATRVESRMQAGWLHAATLSVRAAGASQLTLGGGFQDLRDPLGDVRTRIAWESVDADLGIARRWYALVSAQREHGDEGNGTTVSTRLSFRF